jgi:pimeloyl-ACP methyl ester carboxylesterase
MWHYTECGSGRPLVLLHGIGMSGSAWNSVTPYLSATRRVVAFDIAGFGRTPPLPRAVPPTSANLAAALEESVRAMDLEVPVAIAGNSLGGLIALEAAKRGLARTVVAISPPGLWKEHGAAYVKVLFASLRFLATKAPSILKAAVRPSAAINFRLTPDGSRSEAEGMCRCGSIRLASLNSSSKALDDAMFRRSYR